MTEEQIDSIINNAFKEENENALDNFINNYVSYKKILDEGIMDDVPNAPPGYAERFTGEFSWTFAGFKLAQDNCVNILRKTLKGLLCDEWYTRKILQGREDGNDFK